MGQIIYKITCVISVCVCVCLSVSALAVAILNRFRWNVAQPSGTWNERTLSLGGQNPI